LFDEIAVVGQRQTLPVVTLLMIDAEDRNQPMRVAEGQRTQQQEVRQAEHDAVGRNGQRKGQDDHGRRPAILDQQPRAEAQVLPETANHSAAGAGSERERLGGWRFDADQLTNQIAIVQLPESRTSRSSVGLAGAPEFGVAILQMLGELLCDFGFACRIDIQRLEDAADVARPRIDMRGLHSYLRATTGSTRVARRAGMAQAINATRSSTITTVANVSRSVGRT
jgi:hypothetical protein